MHTLCASATWITPGHCEAFLSMYSLVWTTYTLVSLTIIILPQSHILYHILYSLHGIMSNETRSAISTIKLRRWNQTTYTSITSPHNPFYENESRPGSIDLTSVHLCNGLSFWPSGLQLPLICALLSVHNAVILFIS